MGVWDTEWGWILMQHHFLTLHTLWLTCFVAYASPCGYSKWKLNLMGPSQNSFLDWARTKKKLGARHRGKREFKSVNTGCSGLLQSNVLLFCLLLFIHCTLYLDPYWITLQVFINYLSQSFESLLALGTVCLFCHDRMIYPPLWTASSHSSFKIVQLSPLPESFL